MKGCPFLCSLWGNPPPKMGKRALLKDLVNELTYKRQRTAMLAIVFPSTSAAAKESESDLSGCHQGGEPGATIRMGEQGPAFRVYECCSKWAMVHPSLSVGT